MKIEISCNIWWAAFFILGVLRLAEVLTCSWWWIFSPLLIPAALSAFLAIVGIACLLLGKCLEKISKYYKS